MSNFRILLNITYMFGPHIVILGVTIPTSAGKRKLTLYKTTAGAPRQYISRIIILMRALS